MNTTASADCRLLSKFIFPEDTSVFTRVEWRNCHRPLILPRHRLAIRLEKSPRDVTIAVEELADAIAPRNVQLVGDVERRHFIGRNRLTKL